jgi:hypothetical protein
VLLELDVWQTYPSSGVQLLGLLPPFDIEEHLTPLCTVKLYANSPLGHWLTKVPVLLLLEVLPAAVRASQKIVQY